MPFKNALRDQTGYQLEIRILKSDQTIRYLYIQIEILLDHNGNLDGLIGFVQDITNSKVSDDLLEKEKQLTQLYDNPDVGIWSTRYSQQVNTKLISKGIEHISGYTREDYHNGVQWSSIVHPEDLQQYMKNQTVLVEGNILRHQYRIMHKNGDIRWVQDYTIPTLDDNGKHHSIRWTNFRYYRAKITKRKN